MKQRLKSWLSLTKTPEHIQTEITERMRNDMRGKEKTGFSPYMEDNEICFHQKWILIIGRKSSKARNCFSCILPPVFILA